MLREVSKKEVLQFCQLLKLTDDRDDSNDKGIENISLNLASVD